MARMTFFFLLFSLFVFGLSNISEAQTSSTVPGIYVFGDSLVDVGNNNYLAISLAKADFPHNGVDFPGKKATGRFSNGKNAADFLAEKVGLPTSPPYLSLVNKLAKRFKGNVPVTGVSFASGGAGIFNGTDEQYKQSIPLTKQVQYYSLVHDRLVQQLGFSEAGQQLSKSLFAIVIGSNDLFGYFGSDSKDAKQYTPQQFVDLMLSALNGHMKTLHSLGARKFVVTGIGALGCCPAQRRQNTTQECREEVNYWATKYNDGLKSTLQGLKSSLKDINYSYFDTYSVMSNFVHDPATYGFLEVKAACCGLGDLRAEIPCIPISTYCSNRRDHLFWDLYHPTEAASRMFADMIYNGTQQYTIPMNVKQLVTV